MDQLGSRDRGERLYTALQSKPNSNVWFNYDSMCVYKKYTIVGSLLNVYEESSDVTSSELWHQQQILSQTLSLISIEASESCILYVVMTFVHFSGCT